MKYEQGYTGATHMTKVFVKRTILFLQCDACRKELSRVPIAATESADLFESSEDVAASTHPAEETSYQLESLKTINQCLSAIGETPIVKKKLQQTKYIQEKR